MTPQSEPSEADLSEQVVPVAGSGSQAQERSKAGPFLGGCRFTAGEKSTQ